MIDWLLRLLLLLRLTLLLLSILMPADTVREAVKSEIRAVTGLDPVLRGDASVSLFPAGQVTFELPGRPALNAAPLPKPKRTATTGIYVAHMPATKATQTGFRLRPHSPSASSLGLASQAHMETPS